MEQGNITILQHAGNEPGGLFEEYFQERGKEVLHVPIYETNEVPPIQSTHLLVMGGPMSVNDEDELPWLRTEKQIIRDRVAKGQPVLGICLGAQLIASAFGAAVYPCEEELGWTVVTAERNAAFQELPGKFVVFQMHGETFDLPRGALLVCRGEKVPNQGFCTGSALGLQFHVELTPEIIRDWISDRPIQQQAPIFEGSRHNLSKSKRVCRIIADRFLSAPPSGFSWV